MRPRGLRAFAVALVAGAALLPAAAAHASGGATWQLEQPLPPAAADGEQPTVPIGLGKVGDIEFWAPNRGLLITAGNPPSIPPGIWFYNGVEWRELATVCGATDGRIAWAGPEEFWTVSDGRAGQAIGGGNGEKPPLLDNTLCHFSGGRVITSYAKPAFEADSYQAMAGAACFEPDDCWFGGAELEAPQIGAFQLHWNGQTLAEQPDPQGYPIESLKNFQGELYEGVDIGKQFSPPQPENEPDRLGEPEAPGEPSDLHAINPEGISPTFVKLTSPMVPVYTEPSMPSWYLEALMLGTDGEAMWGAANPLPKEQFGQSTARGGQVTIVRYAGGAWTQVLGAEHASNPLSPYIAPEGHGQTKQEEEEERANQRVSAVAPEPGSENAWLALGSPAEVKQGDPSAVVAEISPSGTLSEKQTLPSEAERGEGTAPKGTALHLVCPAAEDCWLVTSDGWLYHYANGSTRTLERDTAPAFAKLITERPPDEGVPQVVPDSLPEDDSGLEAEQHAQSGSKSKQGRRRYVALVSAVRSRLVRGTTLELRFRLAVKTRIRLVARRGHRVVAETRREILGRGERTLRVRLNPRRWPSKIELQTHPLAPVPTVPVRENSGSENEVTSTGLARISGLLGRAVGGDW